MLENLRKSISKEQEQAVQAWWQVFQNDQETISAYLSGNYVGDFNLSEWMEDNLQVIDHNIMWEFAPGLSKSYRLVITPESNRELRPLVRFLLKEAPELESFEFYEYRLPENLEQASAMMAHRTNWTDISKIEFQTSIGDLNRVDIAFFSPFKEPKDEQSQKAFLLTEQLLGEEITEKWVGYIDVYEPQKGVFSSLLKKKDIQNSMPLENLKADVTKRIGEIKASLPDKSYCKVLKDLEDQEGVVLTLKPHEQDDYEFKDDLFVAPFVSAELFNAMHGGRNTFFAERFSKNGESFLFLKIDGSADDLNQGKFEDRVSIEGALIDALKGNGCVIGGGTGLRYSYIDFAVTNVEEAIPIIKKTLQDGKLTKRSWLFLHDPDYQAEWIGIWPDSPKPYLKNYSQ